MKATAVLSILFLAACSREPAAPPPPALDGAALFLQYGCASCHGKAGRGDGPAASGVSTRPRDFADLSAYRLGTSAADVARTIETGSGLMPSFEHIPQPEREAIARYVVSLQRPSKEKP